MERVTITSRHEPPAHLVFRLLRCCAGMATSSRSSTCICDRESRSPEPSSSAILHQEMVNKVFWEAIFTTARLLLQVLHHDSSTSSSEIKMQPPSGRSSSSSDHHRQGSTSHIRCFLSNHILPIAYIDLRRHDFAR
jgi:hypothetical protein